MLSIAAMSSGQEQYYVALTQEGYYLHGGEPAGQWFGRGAAHLGLDGDVKAEELCALFRGFASDGTPLVQNAGKENRQPGWDLTFSVPKTVSVLWSQADDQTRTTIQQCVDRAVEKTILDLENEAAACRVGRGG
jgi:conjugative relaxase-like TrwC/TraI family protein